MLESLFDKVAGLKAYIFTEKETPTQVFFCEYCETIENKHCFYRTPSAHYTFPKFFYVMIEFFGRLWIQN